MEVSKIQRERPSHSRWLQMKGTSGSVSIYFITVTAAFVLLTALLIDFSRVAAFRKQAELAVKSGVRSTLSSYDPLIYARYGLFIRGGESANELFRETLAGNVATHGNGGFTFLDTRWEETDVTESRSLAHHDVFRRQILEEMKYKAPIDLSLEMANRFRGVSGAMKQAAATVDLLERMRKVYDLREAAFDDVLAIQRSTGQDISRLLSAEVPYPPVNVEISQSAGGVRTIGDAAVQYEDYVSKRLEDDARREAQRIQEEEKKKREEIGEVTDEDQVVVEDAGPIYGAIIAAYETGTVALSLALSKEAAATRSKAKKSGQKAIEALLRAKETNDEMRAIVEQAQRMPSMSSGDELSEEEAAFGDEQIQSMDELRRTAEELVLDATFFESYALEINLQRSQGVQLANEADSFSSLAAAVPGSTARGAELRSGAARLQSNYSEYVRAYGQDGSVFSERLAILQSHRSRDVERKQEEQKAKSAWSGATQFLSALSGASGSEEEKASFEDAKTLYINNREWNHTEEQQAKTERPSDPSAGRDEAMSLTSGLMDILEGSLLGVRDQLYLSEYAIARLSHYDPSYVKEMLHGGDVSLDLHLQEAEYVLYGLNNPAGNIAAAYGEIFAFRLAIRTMEGLVECRAAGHPLLVLAAALVYGVRNAVLDLTNLVENGKVQLSKYIKADTFYTDYLRLFMLAHGGASNHLSRMINVMEHASGVDFRGAYTYASGEGTASVRLWFFPGVLKVMGRFGDLGGTVKGNRYEATYIADSSYQ